MVASDFAQEIQSVFERLLQKLRGLPQAEVVEVLAFFFIVLFIATFLVLLLIACSCCCSCCCCCAEPRGRKVQVQPMLPR